MATRGARRTTKRHLLRGDGGVFCSARSIHRAASGLFFWTFAGTCLRAAGQSGNSGEPFEMRGVRAAAWARGTLRRRGFARAVRADERGGIFASQRRELALGAGGVSSRYGELAFGDL